MRRLDKEIVYHMENHVSTIRIQPIGLHLDFVGEREHLSVTIILHDHISKNENIIITNRGHFISKQESALLKYHF